MMYVRLGVVDGLERQAHSQVATRVVGSTNTLCNRALFAEQLFTYSGAVPVLTTKMLSPLTIRTALRESFLIYLDKQQIYLDITSLPICR